MRRARRYLLRALLLRCPNCGRASIYAGFLRVRERCSNCRLRLQREPGYFMGAVYLNVIATLTVLLIVLLAVLLARPNVADSFYTWVWIAAILVPLVLFRHSRAIWLSMDYLLSPPGPRDFEIANTVAEAANAVSDHGPSARA